MSHDTEFIQINAVVFRNGARMYATGINFGGIKFVVQRPKWVNFAAPLFCSW